jgi:hypothetical protein
VNGGKQAQFMFGTVNAVISSCAFDIENSLLDSVLGLLVVFLG